MQANIKYILMTSLMFVNCAYATTAQHSHHKHSVRHSHHSTRHQQHGHHTRHHSQQAQDTRPVIPQQPPVADINLANYQAYSSSQQELVNNAFKLNQLHLRYVFGSDDPRHHGMDCSGTINYLLKSENMCDIPRRSDELYQWTRNNGTFYPVDSNDFSSYEFSKLQPGDLLFWSGTYHTHHMDNVTHVMMYLGKNELGQPLMFGATDSRNNRYGWGVSIFDFNVAKRGQGHFMGYSCIPNLTCNDQNMANPFKPDLKS